MQQKKRESPETDNQEKFYLLCERSLEPIIIYDGEKIVDCNDAALSIMGATRKEQLVGSSVEDISPPVQPDGQLSVDSARNIIDEVLRTGKSRFEWVHKDLTGKTFWVEVFLTSVSLNKKNVIYGTWRDITESKKMQEHLRLSEKRYHEMFEKNPLPSVVFDFETLEIIDVNLAAIKNYGFTHEEFTSMKVKDLHTQDELAKLFDHFSGPLLGEKRCWKHVKKNGEIIDVEITGHWLDFPGRIMRIANFIDVTEAKKAEDELRNSYEKLRILSAHIQEVREHERKSIARELHDVLGQILSTVNMDLSWINKKIPEKEKEVLARVSSVLSLMKQAIKTVQKVSSELRPVILDDFGLTAAIEHAALSFQNKTGIAAIIAMDHTIDLDKRRSIALYRIFQEVVTNVIRHAGASKLEVYLHKKGDNIEFIMNDNGRGISDEEISDKNSFGILGMRERALFIGGSFEISGSRGKGTQVKVVLSSDKLKDAV